MKNLLKNKWNKYFGIVVAFNLLFAVSCNRDHSFLAYESDNSCSFQLVNSNSTEIEVFLDEWFNCEQNLVGNYGEVIIDSNTSPGSSPSLKFLELMLENPSLIPEPFRYIQEKITKAPECEILWLYMSMKGHHPTTRSIVLVNNDSKVEQQLITPDEKPINLKDTSLEHINRKLKSLYSKLQERNEITPKNAMNGTLIISHYHKYSWYMSASNNVDLQLYKNLLNNVQ